MKLTAEIIDDAVFADYWHAMWKTNPLVHCLTNAVVQEITANVLLAAGASPAMVIDENESAAFAAISSALVINTGTPSDALTRSMHGAIDAANAKNIPWTLDPVAAGLLAWRDEIISGILAKHPTVIRANASELKALAGSGSGGKGVDSLESSDSAVESAIELALRTQSIVAVTGETDYITDGTRLIAVEGGVAQTTLVVGTGCSLSALTAAYAALSPEKDKRLLAVASACALAKRAATYAKSHSTGAGSFKAAYIDGLFLLSHPAAQ